MLTVLSRPYSKRPYQHIDHHTSAGLFSGSFALHFDGSSRDQPVHRCRPLVVDIELGGPYIFPQGFPAVPCLVWMFSVRLHQFFLLATAQ